MSFKLLEDGDDRVHAVGVAIGMAKKADGSTALAAVVGYLVMMSVFETMSPVVLAGEVNPDGEQLMTDYQVFGGILIGLVTAWLFDKYYRIQQPTYLAFFGGRRFVPIVVSLASLFLAFGLSYLFPFFNSALTSFGEFTAASLPSAPSSTVSAQAACSSVGSAPPRQHLHLVHLRRVPHRGRLSLR